MSTHDDLTLPELRALEASYALLREPGAPPSDAELAVQLARQEAERALLLGVDLQIARQIQDEADELDGGDELELQLAALGLGLEPARAAAALRNTPVVPEQPPGTRAPAPAPAAAVNRAPAPKTSQSGWLSSLVGSVFTWLTAPEAPSSTTSTSGRPTGHTCVICQDPIYGAAIAVPCGHHYDVSCVLELFEASTRDESLYPPRCCRQTISLRAVEAHMKPALLSLFNEKAREFGTKKRVYCADPACSRFLCAQDTYSFWDGYEVACTKPGCAVRTCTKCKGRVRLGIAHRCQADQGEQRVLNMGQQSGWARCPGCEQLIELNLGCFHMTCRCKTEFCYVCKAIWKSCRCPQWDERRLLATAEARVDAQIGARGAGGERDWDEVQRVRRVQPPAVPVNPNVVRPAVVAPAVRAAVTTTARAPAPTAARTTGTITRAGPSRAAAGAGSNSQWGAPPPYVPPPPPYTEMASRSRNGWEAPPLEDQNILSIWVDPPRGNRSVGGSTSSSSSSSGILRPSASTSMSSASGSRNATRAENTSTQTRKARAGGSKGFVSAAERQRLINEAVEELRVNHECEHDRWTFRNGGGRCETCYHRLPLYLFRCNGCQILACNRCRRNRL